MWDFFCERDNRPETQTDNWTYRPREKQCAKCPPPFHHALLVLTQAGWIAQLLWTGPGTNMRKWGEDKTGAAKDLRDEDVLRLGSSSSSSLSPSARGTITERTCTTMVWSNLLKKIYIFIFTVIYDNLKFTFYSSSFVTRYKWFLIYLNFNLLDPKVFWLVWIVVLDYT